MSREHAARLQDAVLRARPGTGVRSVALAVLLDGAPAWHGGIGASGEPRVAQLRHQAGSVSKAVAAMGILAVAARAGLDLDEPLVPHLGGWRPPGAPPGMEDGITLRRALSHTAGLSVPGYPGLHPAVPLPTTEQLLRGEGGDAPAVRLVAPPGTVWRYSGGGFTVAQHWAELATGRGLGELLADEVLRPLGMSESTFDQAGSPRDAVPHDAAGAELPAFRHAALAAAGLRTTAADLARFAAALLRRGPVVETMAAPAPAAGGRYGVGLELRTLDDGSRLLFHTGQNRGWRALVAVLPERGSGIVVLCDGDGGGPLRDAALAQLLAEP